MLSSFTFLLTALLCFSRVSMSLQEKQSVYVKKRFWRRNSSFLVPRQLETTALDRTSRRASSCRGSDSSSCYDMSRSSIIRSTVKPPGALPRAVLTLAANDPLLRKGRWDGTPIVVRKFKLLFWTIPKNACEEFKRLFRRIEGHTDWRTVYNFPRGYSSHDRPSTMLPHDPRTNGLTYLWDYSAAEASMMLNDPTWTNAVFLREPTERFVSAYLDKTVNHKYRGKKLSLTFEQFVENVESGWRDPHWNPQCELVDCRRIMPIMDVVGRFSNLAEDTESLLRRIGAWDEFGSDGWGASGQSPIFRGRAENQDHVTNAKEKKGTYIVDDAMRRRVVRLTGDDLTWTSGGAWVPAE